MKKEQLEYLKTWVTRTRSDAIPTQKGEVNLIDDVITNLDELEKYLEEQASED